MQIPEDACVLRIFIGETDRWITTRIESAWC